MATIEAQIRIRRDTAANFTSANPTLALGEIAYETDTRNIKVGDGATAWTALGYINPYRGGTAAAQSNNTVLGSGAGAALQSGAEYNTLIGFAAGDAITTGDQSVAVGTNALGANQTANNCVAVGHAALLLNTASDITAVGANALDANTTGTGNVAVGKDALGANTTGNNNIAVGGACLDANTTGAFNIAVGYDALGDCVSGSTNIAIGQGALGACTGSQSTGCGTNTGRFVTTGNNVFVGMNAGLYFGSGSGSSDYLTSADESILIGRDVRPGANSQSHQIVIGNSAIGNGSNTTTIGNSSTTATHLRGPSTFSVGANGQSTQLGQSTTLLTGLTGATVTATNLIPANCILLGVTARVTTAITGATTFDIGDGTTANRFGDDIAIALDTTANNCIAPALITAATNVVLTANGGNFTAGAVRLTAHYMTLVAPTS